METLSKVKPGMLGGKPEADYTLNVVRPKFPALHSYADQFEHALSTGKVTNNGKYVVEFEDKLSQYLETEVAVCSSGETALIMLLSACVPQGSDVICPSFTFPGTPHGIVWSGSTPRFADIDQGLCLSPVEISNTSGANIAAVLAVDSYGIPANYEAIELAAAERDLCVLYDSAAAFGATVDGVKVGRHGAGQIFSFHATKPFTTMEGGCVSSRDSALIQTIRELRNFGQRDDGAYVRAGLNGKMMEISALIGLSLLQEIDDDLARRRQAVAQMIEGIEHIPGLETPVVGPGVAPTWSLLPIVVNAAAFGLSRDHLVTALEHENIFVRTYFDPPCHTMPAYAELPQVTLPVTTTKAAGVVAIPVYNDMTAQECGWIVSALEKIHDNARQILSALTMDDSRFGA